MRFYIHPPSVRDREIIYETIIPDTYFRLAGFQHDRLGSVYYADIEGLFTAPETGEYEFGLTTFGSGNLHIDDALVIENTTKQRFGTWYFGKGTMEERAVVRMVGGQDYRVKMEFGSAATSKVIKPGAVSYGGGAGRLGVIQLIDEEESIARSVKLAKEHKHTIVCAGLTVRNPVFL
jgi:beta-glucosidase